MFKFGNVIFVLPESTHNYTTEGEFDLVGEVRESIKGVIKLSEPISLPFDIGELDLKLKIRGMEFTCSKLISAVDKELVFTVIPKSA